MRLVRLEFGMEYERCISLVSRSENPFPLNLRSKSANFHRKFKPAISWQGRKLIHFIRTFNLTKQMMGPSTTDEETVVLELQGLSSNEAEVTPKEISISAEDITSWNLPLILTSRTVKIQVNRHRLALSFCTLYDFLVEILMAIHFTSPWRNLGSTQITENVQKEKSNYPSTLFV